MGSRCNGARRISCGIDRKSARQTLGGYYRFSRLKTITTYRFWFNIKSFQKELYYESIASQRQPA